MIKKLSTFFIFFVLAIGSLVCEEDMLVYASDIRLEYVGGNTFDTVSGYHLYIRKKDGVESVMLTETTKDPAGKEDNYAFRALEYNTYNGDEIRYLDGKPLVSEGAKYSLIDSTPEDDAEFGSCFHIFIPAEMQYGYPWTRNGTIKIKRGTFINIRTFEKKYGDYEGSFADNPFMFDLGLPEEEPVPVPEPEPIAKHEEIPVAEEKEPVPILTDDYNSDAASKFKEIANTASGRIIYSRPVSLIDDIMKSIDSIDPKEAVDVVFAIDTTGSMKDDVALLKDELVPRLLKELHKFGKLRLGLLLYRDYG
ncbi:MAG: VWA domain-containing protein, partial [Treponema sp.]|nr:VWA domain-containing protein [Treponema sp.]